MSEGLKTAIMKGPRSRVSSGHLFSIGMFKHSCFNVNIPLR